MTSCGLLLLCALTTTLQVHDVTSWSFRPSFEPLLASINKNDSGFSVKIMCRADTALDKCQVNMYDKDYSHDFIDLSRGSNSGVISRYHERNSKVPMYNASYFGTGLENGQCGAVYSFAAAMAYHFGCRGANAAGEWQEKDLVLAHSLSAVDASITPLKAIVKPGSDVTILLHSVMPMFYCELVQTAHTRDHIFFMKGTTTKSYRYFGSGPSQGDCGITLLNVTEDNNGPLSITGTRSFGPPVSQLVSTVIVATPPAKVSLRLYKKGNGKFYAVGDKLNATCVSLLSRPVANMTWYLGGKIIRQDTKRDLEDDVWSWSWEKQNITQFLNYTLREEDLGKKLQCRVQHLDTVTIRSSVVRQEARIYGNQQIYDFQHKARN